MIVLIIVEPALSGGEMYDGTDLGKMLAELNLAGRCFLPTLRRSFAQARCCHSAVCFSTFLQYLTIVCI